MKSSISSGQLSFFLWLTTALAAVQAFWDKPDILVIVVDRQKV